VTGSKRHRRRSRRGDKSERGIALIVVSMALVFLVATTVEFGTNTNVDAAAAANARDDVRAHFLARSGVNLSRLMIAIQTEILDSQQVRSRVGDIQLAEFAPLFVSAFGGSPEEVQAMSALLGGLQGEAIKGLGVSSGQFEITMTTEDGKININCGNTQNSAEQDVVAAQLRALMFFDAFNPIFERPDAEGWQRDRETQVAAFLDYVDRDRGRYGSPGTPEDYGYEGLRDKYEAKNNYLDSIGEIKQIRGVDDRFWTLFGGQLTIYGSCKINLAAANDPKLFAAIITLAAKDPNNPVLADSNKLWSLARLVIEARNLGLPFTELKAFADFVKDPAAALADVVGLDPSSPDAAAAAGALGAGGLVNLIQQVEGVELDQAKLGTIAEVGPRRTYRVEVTSQVGGPRRRTIKTITAIWDTNVVQQNPRTVNGAVAAGTNNGAWIYWQEN
jgi:general secretion pathway protein K